MDSTNESNLMRRHIRAVAAASRFLELTALHEHYQGSEQIEAPDQVAMAASGHPHARTYRRLRRFYDRLPVCSGARSRYFTAAPSGESAEYLGPALELSQVPDGPLARFGAPAPTDPAWPRYVRAVAEAGWPAEALPGMDAGQWLVMTHSPELLIELYALRFMGLQIVGALAAPGSVLLVLSPDERALKQQAAIVQALRRHQSRARLRRRHFLGGERPAVVPPADRLPRTPLRHESISQEAFCAAVADMCPVCRSSDISCGFVEVVNGRAEQEQSCMDCPASWKAFYMLAGYRELDKGT